MEIRGETTYQVPPTALRRSNTRIVSKACSLTRASVAIAPAGPAPITATRRLDFAMVCSCMCFYAATMQCPCQGAACHRGRYLDESLKCSWLGHLRQSLVFYTMITFQTPSVDSDIDFLSHVWGVCDRGGEAGQCDHFEPRRRHRELETSRICAIEQHKYSKTRIDKPTHRKWFDGSFEVL